MDIQAHPLKAWCHGERRTMKWLAEQIGQTPEHLSRLCANTVTITRTTALAIERVTDGGVTLKDWGLE